MSALRSELSRREDDFQGDLSLFSERDQQQRSQIEAMQRDAKASSEAQAQKMSVLSASLEEAQRHNEVSCSNHHRHLLSPPRTTHHSLSHTLQELLGEIHALQASTEESAVNTAQAEARRREVAERLEASEASRSKEREQALLLREGAEHAVRNTQQACCLVTHTHHPHLSPHLAFSFTRAHTHTHSPL